MVIAKIDRAYLLRTLTVAAIAVLLSTWLHASGKLAPVESSLLDIYLKTTRLQPSHTVVVAITNDDYRKLFGYTSPLDATTVQRLLDRIAAGRPALIVVDVDTSDSSFAGLKPPSGVRCIWARTKDKRTAARSIELVPGQVEAVAALPQDHDGVIRFYTRTVPGPFISDEQQRGIIDTIPWVAASQIAPGISGRDASPEQRLPIALIGSKNIVPFISAGDLLALPDERGATWTKLIEGKVVLLGGHYDAARDLYRTPEAMRAGVDLLALAIESELQRGEFRAVSDAELFAVQAVSLFVWVLLNCVYRHTWLPYTGLFLVPFLAEGVSVVMLRCPLAGLYVVPTFVATHLQVLYEHVRFVLRQNRTLSLTNEELTRTKLDLARAVDSGAQQERKRVANGLHDDVIPELRTLYLQVDSLIRGKLKEHEQKSVLQQLEHAQEKMSEMMRDLYPAELEKHGLKSALQELLNRARRTGLEARLADFPEELEGALSKDDKLRVYGIVKEAINNTVRHAKASKLEVCVSLEGDLCLLKVSDNGIGLSPDRSRPDSRGMVNMHTRAELLNGRLTAASPASAYGSGTELTLNFPNPNSV